MGAPAVAAAPRAEVVERLEHRWADMMWTVEKVQHADGSVGWGPALAKTYYRLDRVLESITARMLGDGCELGDHDYQQFTGELYDLIKSRVIEWAAPRVSR